MTQQKQPISSSSALRIDTLADLLADTSLPPETIMAPWLKQGDSAMIFAAPASGKSMLTLGLALAVAGGGSFLGWKVEKPRKVLFVDGEMPKADTIERVRMLLPAAEGCNVGEAGRNLKFFERQAQDLRAHFPDLGNPQDQEFMLKLAREHEAELVILDNFSTLVDVEDENSAAALSPIVKFLMRMKQAGIACILVHHSKKDGDTYRGSSKLATTFEVIMQLKKTEGARAAGRLSFELDWNKYRRRQDETTRGRTVWLEAEHEGAPMCWRFEVARREYLSDIVAMVQSRKYAYQRELAAELGMSEGQLSKLKNEATLDHKLITAQEWTAHFEAAREAAEEEDAAF